MEIQDYSVANIFQMHHHVQSVVTELLLRTELTCLIPRPPHFCLPFVSTIIHDSGGPALPSHALLIEDKNGGGLGMRLGAHMCFMDV